MPRFKKQRKRCTPKKEHENIDNDRLSSLPDNLLITILSLLPFSKAVATSVLSHRWRHLWTYLTHVSFMQPTFHKNKFCKLKNFITAVDHVISKLTSPKIHTFYFCMRYSEAEQQECCSLVAPIIDEICLRLPKVIRLDSIGCIVSRTPLCHLPSSLFTTQSLVELKLSPTWFDFPVDAQIAINLPNLKILEICLWDSQRCLMHTLFKSCPLLERLYLKLQLDEDDHHVDIVAPNLKFLTIEACNDKTFLLLVDAPMLISLNTCGLVFYNFVNNLNCLQEAKVFVPNYHAGHGSDYRSRILALFQGISCATSLTFSRCFHDYLSDVALPSFPNLINLRFDDFDEGSNSWMPSCWLKNIKSLMIFKMRPDNDGIRFVKDILSHATVLEQLHVFHYESNYVFGDTQQTRAGKEYVFAMKLFNLPKISSSCQIKLFGDIITASCEDFRHGRLTCKLKDLTRYLSI